MEHLILIKFYNVSVEVPLEHSNFVFYRICGTILVLKTYKCIYTEVTHFLISKVSD